MAYIILAFALIAGGGFRLVGLTGKKEIGLDEGFIPRFIRHIPDNKPVFIAPQNYLLQHRQEWLDNLDGPSIYISTSYAGEKKGREKILAALGRTHEIIPVRERRMTREMIYEIRPK